MKFELDVEQIIHIKRTFYNDDLKNLQNSDKLKTPFEDGSKFIRCFFNPGDLPITVCFTNCVFESCTFYNDVLEYITFENCAFNHCKFVNIKNFRYIKFKKVRFNSCELSNVNMFGADLSDSVWTNNMIIDGRTLFYNQACPEDGSFIAYKQALAFCKDRSIEPCLVTIKVTKNAKRSSATTRKCRCSKAKVLNCQLISQNEDGTRSLSDDYRPLRIYSRYSELFYYNVGDTIECEKPFDENRWKECSSGIHFFMNKVDAIYYR